MGSSHSLVARRLHSRTISSTGQLVRALTDALRGLSLDRGLILTDASAAPIMENGLTIEVRSLTEWLLQP
jgi:hypothetical protein